MSLFCRSGRKEEKSTHAWGTERVLSSGERRHGSRIFEATYWASAAGLPLAVLAFVALAALNIR
jgi:hypothetical protein